MNPKQLIEKLAEAQAAADAARTAGTTHYVPATTSEILDTVSDSGTGLTTAWFVFDFVILHSAQSGSDWYHHHVFAGSATIREDAVIDSAIERLREGYVSEFTMEWAPDGERYDHDRVRCADRDTWWQRCGTKKPR